MHEMDGNLRFLLNGGYLKNDNAVFEKYGCVFPTENVLKKRTVLKTKQTLFSPSRRGAAGGGARGMFSKL